MDMTVSTRDFAELSGFRRDLLIVIGGLDTPKGLEIKTELEQYYDEEIHHGRLYPNLDTLTEQGLVEKIAVDNRSNGYNLTDLGEAHLHARREWEIDRIPSSTETTKIPTEADDRSTDHLDTEQPEANELTTDELPTSSLPDGRVDTLTGTVLDYDTDPESNHVARLQVKLEDGTELPLNIWHDLALDWVVGATYTIEQAQHISWEGNTGTEHKLNSTQDFRATRVDTDSASSAPDPAPNKDKSSSDAHVTESGNTPTETTRSDPEASPSRDTQEEADSDSSHEADTVESEETSEQTDIIGDIMRDFDDFSDSDSP